jgi:hypothetical protein
LSGGNIPLEHRSTTPDPFEGPFIGVLDTVERIAYLAIALALSVAVARAISDFLLNFFNPSLSALVKSE